MANLNAPKLLSIGVQFGDILEYWPTSTPPQDIDGMPKQWRVEMNVNAQLHSGRYSSRPFQYDGRDLTVGMYIATGSNAQIFRVDEIISQNASQVVAKVSDEDKLNALMDDRQDGNVYIQEGPGIAFEVKQRIPVLFPLPSVLPANFSRGFATQILNRFLFRERPDTLAIHQPGHTMTKKTAVVLNNTGLYEAVDFTKPTSQMTKRIIGVVEEVGWPTVDDFRIRTIGPVVDIMLGGNPGTLYFIDGSTTTGSLINLDPNSATQQAISGEPVYIVIDDFTSVFIGGGLFDTTTSTTVYTVSNQTELNSIIGVPGDTAFVTDSGNLLGSGEWAYYIYADGAWVLLSTEDVAGSQKSYKTTVAWNDMNTKLIHRVDHNVRVMNVSVEVTQPFNGGATLTVGDGNDVDRHMTVNENDLSDIGTYYSFPNHLYDEIAEVHVNAYLSKGNATQGSAEVLITYV